MTCTGIRQIGNGQKGYFDLPAGTIIGVNVGYRVYRNAND